MCRDQQEALATSADEAAQAAARIGGPVALKVQSPDITHKTEAGGIALGIVGETAVREAYERVLGSAKRAYPEAVIRGVLVQAMAPPGREIILGITRDAGFGPMLMVGLGGIHVEVLRDIAFAPVPIGAEQALALLDQLKGAALLGAVRGAPPADRTALAELIATLSRFAADHAELIEEIDLNPVIVHPQGQGLTVVDALIVKRSPRGDPQMSDTHVSQDGYVATVEMRRPPHNFFDSDLIAEIGEAFERLDADPAAARSCSRPRAVRSAPGPTSRNAWRPGTVAEGSRSGAGRHLYKEAIRLFRTRKPIIAAVHGAAVGGGLGLALVADFRVTCQEARFSANFNRLGFHPGFGLTATLPRLVGVQQAALMFYTGGAFPVTKRCGSASPKCWRRSPKCAARPRHWR